MAKNRIKELRKAQNSTLNDLVELLAEKDIKVNESQLSKFEKGTSSPRSNIYDSFWQALSDIFGVSVPYIKGDSDYQTGKATNLAFFHEKLPLPDGTRLMTESQIIGKYGEKILESIKNNISDKWFKDVFLNTKYSEYDNFINSINQLYYIKEDFFDVVVLLAGLDDNKRESLLSFMKHMID